MVGGERGEGKGWDGRGEKEVGGGEGWFWRARGDGAVGGGRKRWGTHSCWLLC